MTMRSLFLVLLLANLLFFAIQLNLFGDLVHESHGAAPPEPLNAERLRIVRDTSASTSTPTRAAPTSAPRASGTLP